MFIKRPFTAFIVATLLMICFTGCGPAKSATPYHSPLDGWQLDFNPPQVIEDDAKAYIDSLHIQNPDFYNSPVSYISTNGEHAEQIEVGKNNIYTEHVLFYGTNNVRINVIIQKKGGYGC